MSSEKAKEKAALELEEFEKKQEETKEERERQGEVMGVTLSRARQDMTMAVLQIQNMYGLPAYLTDLILTAVLADIRDCANKDFLISMSK